MSNDKQVLQNQYNKLRRTHDKLEKEHTDVLNSMSWRITKPLRKMNGLARRVRRAVDRRVAFWLHAAHKRNKLVFYRIIGNDLYPRHAKGQQYNNLKFILENEADLEDCQKVFIVNRIIDKQQEKKVLALLKKHDCEFIYLPFEKDEYKKVGWDTSRLPDGWLHGEEYNSLDPRSRSHAITSLYRHKNNYIMNNNGARNAALHDGKKRNARWILPWDGNCFMTPSAWDDIRRETKKGKYLKFFVVPMVRETNNSNLLKNDYQPKPESEPQIIFRTDSQTEFNEQYSYGRRPKVELFWCLGISGPWDKWRDFVWDIPRRAKSSEAGEYGYAGWVARLNSGQTSQEKETNGEGLASRGDARNEAIMATVHYIDNLVFKRPEWNELLNYDTITLANEVRQDGKTNAKLQKIINRLEMSAKEALERSPYSVVDKTTLPPGGNKQDYWHVSPYAHPNPNTPDGLPYIVKDGQRVEGTKLYEPASEKYDRTRIQRVFDDSITLALAWKFTGNKDYAKHGAQILQRFFINEDTRMNPHMEYAQVWMGKNNNRGIGRGIIEAKDMYYYLDAVRILHESGVVNDGQIANFKEWLREFLQWLLSSEQGLVELASANNHGTFYDMQVAAIAEFIEDSATTTQALLRAKNRIGQQFQSDGSQPEELRRTLSQHYCYFNLQAWLVLATIGRRHDIDLWGYSATNKVSLPVAVDWLLEQSKDWQHTQIDMFDKERIEQLHHLAKSLGYSLEPKEDKYSIKPVFFAHDGIRPYWNLGLQGDKSTR